MSWVKYDDNFPDHPKLLALGKRYESGIAVHVAIASWCSRNLTDGRIPKHKANTVTPSARKTCQEMVRVGLLHDDGDYYLLNDYLDYNPSRAQVMEHRQRNRERQDKHRNGARNGVTNTAPSPTPKDKDTSTSKTGARKRVGYTPEFEEFWKVYPRTDGKAAAFRAWNARLKDHAPDVMIAGAGRYASYCERENIEPRYMKMPATFLGPDEWFTESWQPKKKEVEW